MITPTLPAVGDPTERGWAQAVIDALVDLNSGGGGGGGGGSTGASLLLNGSFEIDADANSEPDNWTITTQTNGAFTLSGHSLGDTNCISGARAIKFTSIGGGSNGGGQAVSDFFEVTPLHPLKIEWMWYCTSTTAANFVKIDFYDAAQAFISPTVTVWSRQINNPSTWLKSFGCATPPATARYAKLTLIGCDSSIPTACSTYFDGVAVSNTLFLRRAVYHCDLTATSGNYKLCHFTAPVTGPYRITCFGAGGAGASDSADDTGEVGGGSGAMAQSTINLTAGTEYDVWPGRRGEATANSSGTAGQDSIFTVGGTGQMVRAAGGKGGAKNGSAGAGGAVVDSTGDIIIAGNAGGSVTAGHSGDGANSVYGLCGGNGVYRSAGEAPATHSFGAGGSGGWSHSTAGGSVAGGHGGFGAVIIEW